MMEIDHFKARAIDHSVLFWLRQLIAIPVWAQCDCQRRIQHRRLSPTEGYLPPKVKFCSRLSFTEGHLPHKVIFHRRLYGYLQAFIVSDFNFVGDASTLIKKGSSESIIDINDFREIFIKEFEPDKQDQAVLELGECSKHKII